MATSSESIGKYQVLGTLGQGAHSTILRIRRASDSRQYALKVVPIEKPEHQKFLQQAKHEHRVAQMFDHPNLLKVLVLETETDWLFRVKKVNLLLEYVNGQTLDMAPKLSLPQLVQVFVKVASGLVHMHRKGVCHADMKPNNIMLSKAGDVKIIDYGLAWIKGEPKGRIQGTPEYLAPETANNKTINERSDIYNFGATMYRMLTGKLPPCVLTEGSGLPIDARTFMHLFQSIKDINPKVPRVLGDLVERCLAFEPAKRPERVSMLQGALDHLADELVRSPEDRLEAIQWE